MQFPLLALERAMKVKEVIFRAISGEYMWLQAAEILGMSPRSLRRWRYRMERHGYSGLIDMRRGVPSPRRAPVAEIQRIVGLYRDTYRGYNARHFYQTVGREHGVTLSYTYVRQLLQGAGLMKKGRARGRHRTRRVILWLISRHRRENGRLGRASRARQQRNEGDGGNGGIIHREKS